MLTEPQKKVIELMRLGKPLCFDMPDGFDSICNFRIDGQPIKFWDITTLVSDELLCVGTGKIQLTDLGKTIEI